MFIIKYPRSNEKNWEDMGGKFVCMWDKIFVMTDFVWDDIVKINLKSGKSVRLWARFSRPQDGIQ